MKHLRYEESNYYMLNIANQGRPVKIVNGSHKGRTGVYTGLSNWGDTAYVRLGTTYIEVDVEENSLIFLPKGSLTEALYG